MNTLLYKRGVILILTTAVWLGAPSATLASTRSRIPTGSQSEASLQTRGDAPKRAFPSDWPTSRRLDWDYKHDRIAPSTYVRFGLTSLIDPRALPSRYKSDVREKRSPMWLGWHYARAWDEIQVRTERSSIRNLGRVLNPLGPGKRRTGTNSVSARHSPDGRREVISDHMDLHIQFAEHGFEAPPSEDCEEWPYGVGRVFVGCRSEQNPDGGNGIPDFVDKLRYGFERAYDVYTNPPFSFSPLDKNLLVFVQEPLSPSYAVPIAETIHIDHDAPNPLLVARHELFHVIQMQYFAQLPDDFGDASMWWIEASAEWAAHNARDPRGDPVGSTDFYENEEVAQRGVPDFLVAPQRRLVYYGLPPEDHAYNSFIFVEWLERTMGSDFVKEVFIRMALGDLAADHAIEQEVAARESSFAEVLRNFGIANYLLDTGGYFSPSEYYSQTDADLFRSALLDSDEGLGIDRPARADHVEIAVGTAETGSVVVQPGGTSYIDVVRNPGVTGRVVADIDIDELDGMDPSDYTITLLSFDTYPNLCDTTPPEGTQFTVVLGPDCDLATVVITHTDPVGWVGDGEFAWTIRGTSPYPFDVMKDNPVAYWRLGEAVGPPVSTTAGDSSGFARHGTYHASVELNRQGSLRGDPNTSVKFSGSKAEIPYDAGLSTERLTVEAWVRTRRLDGSTRTAVYRPNAFTLAVKDGKALGSIGHVGSNGAVQPMALPGTSRIDDGRWHHVAIVFDGTDGHLYVDGKEEGPGYPTSLPLNPSVNGGIKIGEGLTTSTSSFIGDIDEVAIFDHALGQSTFLERVDSRWTRTPECDPASLYEEVICDDVPSGYWRLGDFQGTSSTATDVTGIQDGVYKTGVSSAPYSAIAGESNGAITSLSSGDREHLEIPYEDYGTYASMEELTVEAWIRTLRSDGSDRTAVYRPAGFSLSVKEGKATASFSHVGTITAADTKTLVGPQINEGGWHHVAATFDGVQAVLYVDGEQKDSYDWTAPLYPSIGNGIRIGEGSTSTDTDFLGDIDEVAIYDHALTPADMEERFTHRWRLLPDCGGGSSAYALGICDVQPVGYWRLGETSGPPALDQTDLQDGSYGASVAFGSGALSESNGAITTNTASDGYGSVAYEPYGNYSTLENLSVETWIRTTRVDSYERCAVCRDSAFRLGVKGGKAWAAVSHNAVTPLVVKTLTGTTNIADGEWHHLVITYNGTSGKLYVDGQPEGTPYPADTRVFSSVGKGIRIGRGSVSSSNTAFMGSIDEVAIYDHALTATTVSNHWGLR